jgi:hypothetical protein
MSPPVVVESTNGLVQRLGTGRVQVDPQSRISPTASVVGPSS